MGDTVREANSILLPRRRAQQDPAASRLMPGGMPLVKRSFTQGPSRIFQVDQC